MFRVAYQQRYFLKEYEHNFKQYGNQPYATDLHQARIGCLVYIII